MNGRDYLNSLIAEKRALSFAASVDSANENLVDCSPRSPDVSS